MFPPSDLYWLSLDILLELFFYTWTGTVSFTVFGLFGGNTLTDNCSKNDPVKEVRGRHKIIFSHFSISLKGDSIEQK